MRNKMIISLAVLAVCICMGFITSSHAAGRGISVTTDSGKSMELYGGSHALLVGVGNYSAGWPKLESVPREIRQIADVLKKHGFKVRTVIDPNGKQLEQAFESFVDNHGYDAENRLLFFYSGHGFTRKNGRLGYLVPADAPLPNRDLKGFLQKSLTMNRILSWCRGMEAKHALFLFDSCFSGTVFKAKSAPLPKHISLKTARPVRQFISAGSAKQEVPAQSVFAPSFIKGIQGEADLNRDGYVTGSELGEYLLEKVPYYNDAQTPQYGKIRDPNLDEGDFVFLLTGGPGTAPAIKSPPPPAPPKAPSVDDLKALEEEAKRKGAWDQWQQRMDEYWRKLESLDATGLAASKKAGAWQGALVKFGDDNPFSRQDEALRRRAGERAAYWERRTRTAGRQLESVKAGGPGHSVTIANRVPSNKPVYSGSRAYRWKMVTTWPPMLPYFQTAAERMAKTVGDLSRGKFRIRVYAAGELVPAFGTFDAVSKGVVQAGMSIAYYWAGKEPAFQWFASVPFGLNAYGMDKWLHEGGGMKLWEELCAKYNQVPRSGGNTGMQMGGWFNRKIKSMADFRGLKMRIPGLGGKVLAKAGGTVVLTPGGEIFINMERGVIDATEWVGPFHDKIMGFYKVAKYYYYPGWHEPGTNFMFQFNKKDYEALPAELRRILDYACADTAQWVTKGIREANRKALGELVNRHKVRLERFPSLFWINWKPWPMWCWRNKRPNHPWRKKWRLPTGPCSKGWAGPGHTRPEPITMISPVSDMKFN